MLTHANEISLSIQIVITTNYSNLKIYDKVLIKSIYNYLEIIFKHNTHYSFPI